MTIVVTGEDGLRHLVNWDQVQRAVVHFWKRYDTPDGSKLIFQGHTLVVRESLEEIAQRLAADKILEEKERNAQIEKVATLISSFLQPRQEPAPAPKSRTKPSSS